MKRLSNILEKIERSSAPEFEIQYDEVGPLGSDELNKTFLTITADDIISFL